MIQRGLHPAPSPSEERIAAKAAQFSVLFLPMTAAVPPLELRALPTSYRCLLPAGDLQPDSPAASFHRAGRQNHVCRPFFACFLFHCLQIFVDQTLIGRAREHHRSLVHFLSVLIHQILAFCPPLSCLISDAGRLSTFAAPGSLLTTR